MKKILLSTTCLFLVACGGVPKEENGTIKISDRTATHGTYAPVKNKSSNKPEQSLAPTAQSKKIDSALEAAAIAAAVKGNTSHSLSYLEKIYVRKPNDPVAGINYAKALRRSGESERAAIVLEPFAKSDVTPSIAKTEYAATQLALGNMDAAELYAQRAIDQNKGDAHAYHYLGVALDSKGEHEAAETALRKGLDLWQGDPIPIMNNLALNLASQNNLDEALAILNKAKAIAPQRIEVERNLRIVKALMETYNYNPDDYL